LFSSNLRQPQSIRQKVQIRVQIFSRIRGPVKPGTSYHCTMPCPARSGTRSFTAGFIDSWTRESLAQLGVQPPAGEKWSGHEL
jgi:hypothetical protein